MSETRQTLRDAVDQAMKYEVWVKPGEFRSEDVYYVAEVGQVSPDYDSADEAQKACHALNIDAAIATVFEALREPSDALFAAVASAISRNIRLEWRGHDDAIIPQHSVFDAADAALKAILDASEKERSNGQ